MTEESKKECSCGNSIAIMRPEGKVCHDCGGSKLTSNHKGKDMSGGHEEMAREQKEKEYTGGSVSYYTVRIEHPLSGCDPYEAECNDIIEALGMNYSEGNAFKAIWRSCAARNLGAAKLGYKDGLYDAEKVVWFGGRMVEQAKRLS